MKKHSTNHFRTESLSLPSDRPSISDQLKPKTLPGNKHFTTFITGWILRSGVILSASITLLGLLLMLIHPGGISEQSLQLFPQPLGQVWLGLMTLQPQAIIALGLLVLIATQVLSVIAALVGFALEHDRADVVIALIVLATLVMSFWLGKAG